MATYRLRIQLRILMLERPRLRARDINHPIDDHMRDVHALGPELAGQRLRQRAQGELARRERGEVRRAPHAGRRPREDEGRRVLEVRGLEEQRERLLGEVEGSFAVGDVSPCVRKKKGAALSVESGVGREGRWSNYLPLRLEPGRELLGRQLEERLAHETTSGVEHGRGERRAGELLRDLLEGGLDVLGVGEVDAEARGLAAGGVDLVDDGLVVGGVAGEHDDGVGFGEAAGNGGALFISVSLYIATVCRGVGGTVPFQGQRRRRWRKV